MATIVNPTPVSAATFGKMWIAGVFLAQPINGAQGSLFATLLPYDGTHLLATGGKRVAIPSLKAPSPAVASLISSLTTELARQSKNTATLSKLYVTAPDPAHPVSIRAEFADHTNYTIKDAFTLAGTDSIFAGVFTTALGTLATMAGLTVTD